MLFCCVPLFLLSVFHLPSTIKEFTKTKEKVALKLKREDNEDRQRNGGDEGSDLLADFGSDEENRHDDKL